jgi:hypothetical protein
LWRLTAIFALAIGHLRYDQWSYHHARVSSGMKASLEIQNPAGGLAAGPTGSKYHPCVSLPFIRRVAASAGKT